MKITISMPSGFHYRELLLPLHSLFNDDPDIEVVNVVTPAAPHANEFFSTFQEKFKFLDPSPTPHEQELQLKQLAPDLVITNTSGLDHRDIPILRAAKKLDITTLTFISSWDNVWKMGRLKRKGKPQIIADHLIVWNQIMKQHIQRLFPSVTDRQISVIGSPRLDFFKHTSQIPSRRQFFDKLGFSDDSKKLIHFATTELYPMDYVLKDISEAKQYGDITVPLHLFVSVHPGGDITRHTANQQYGATVAYSFGRQANSPHSSFKYLPTRDDIYMHVALFTHSDVLINQSSTVALESFLADRPVININYGAPGNWWQYFRSEVRRDFKEHYHDILVDHPTVVVKNRRQLITALNRYLKQPSLHSAARQKNLKKMITTTDGTASQQLLAKIKQIGNLAR